MLIAPVDSGSYFIADALSPDWRGANGLIGRIPDIGGQLTMLNIGTNKSSNGTIIIIERVQIQSKN